MSELLVTPFIDRSNAISVAYTSDAYPREGANVRENIRPFLIGFSLLTIYLVRNLCLPSAQLSAELSDPMSWWAASHAHKEDSRPYNKPFVFEWRGTAQNANHDSWKHTGISQTITDNWPVLVDAPVQYQASSNSSGLDSFVAGLGGFFNDTALEPLEYIFSGSGDGDGSETDDGDDGEGGN
jgi:hypothetical protein